ncbi:DUF7410 domain-containing protein [Haloarchaeobius salinus]|uniref:DUF7410 domain-containing protein n=1 Tax=Haloarchaeobius salinus TaxID=1198298 RepID=UPI0021088640|nr:C2H2-type zinc finger protein [Haloarchaeobius salinus]
MTGDSTTTAADANADNATADHSETDVPAGVTAHRCPYCDRPFRRAEQCTLHVGLEHYDRMTEAEEDAFREVYESEEEELGLYRLKLVGGLVVVYFGMLLLYAVVT